MRLQDEVKEKRDVTHSAGVGSRIVIDYRQAHCFNRVFFLRHCDAPYILKVRFEAVVAVG